MAMHIGTMQMPAPARDRTGVLTRYLIAILSISVLTLATVLAVWPSPPSAPSPRLEQAVSRSLSQDTPDSPARLLRANATALGDLDIEVALRDRGNPQANRVAALDDVLAVTRAVYQTHEARPLNVTLIGVWRDPSSTRAVPVVYASMPADRLAGQDLVTLRADDLERLGTVRWMPGGLCQAWNACEGGLAHAAAGLVDGGH